ncbi:MAG: hypothetical protein BAA00_01575 [Parageobacillus thermoglucosidasius]|nr:MAG: hypothetical protein BAA00_01575 [Parageobacillus thermoglucosidasius]
MRAELERKMAELDDIELVIPPLSLCTDNAAMIAAAGTVLFEQGKRADMTLNADPSLELA